MNNGISQQTKCILNKQSIILFLPIILIFLLETSVIKLYFLIHVFDTFGWNTFFKAWMPDFSVSILVFLLFTVIYSISYRLVAIRRLVQLSFYVFMLYMIIISAVNVIYYRITGEQLTAQLLFMWIDNFSDVTKIILSESSLIRFVLISIPALLLLAWIIGINVYLRKRPYGHDMCVHNYVALVVILTLLGAYLYSVSVPKLQGAIRPLSSQIGVQLLAELIIPPVDTPDTEIVRIPDNMRFDQPLVVQKDSAKIKPNIVFIVVEGVSWKNSDVYTPGLGSTPFLASIAQDSLVIDRHYTIIPHTTKSLVPIICGIYPYIDMKAYETMQDAIPPRCLPHILRSQGYVSAFFESAHSFERRRELVRNMGFDVYMDLDDMDTTGFEDINYFGKEDNATIPPSMDWIDSVGEKPFFLTYMTVTTHHNYVVPRSFPYKDFGVKDKTYNDYLNTVLYTDGFIQNVFKELDRRGKLNDTIVVIVSDHGEAFGEHITREHDFVLWEEGIRCLSMIYAPKLVGARHISGMRSHIDILPTIIDLLGIKVISGNIIGHSLMAPPIPDRELYHRCTYSNSCAAMHEGFLKTIYFYDRRPVEIYDETKDVFDLHNLYGQNGFDDSFASVRIRKMLRFEQETNYQYRMWQKKMRLSAYSDHPLKLDKSFEVNFEDLFFVVSASLPKQPVQSGTFAKVDFSIRCGKNLSMIRGITNMKLSILLENEDGETYDDTNATEYSSIIAINHSKNLSDYGYLLKSCPVGKFLHISHFVHVPESWNKGKVKLFFGVMDVKKEKLVGIRSVSDGTQRRGDRFLVGEFEVVPSVRHKLTEKELSSKISKFISTEPFHVERELNVAWGGFLKLYGVTPKVVDSHWRGSVEFELVFEVIGKIPKGTRIMFKFYNDRGEEFEDIRYSPLGGILPLNEWKKGWYVLDRYLSNTYFQAGAYEAWMSVETNDGEEIPPVCPSNIRCSKRGVFIENVSINGNPP